MAAIETEIWAEMRGETSPAGRVVYGLFHWMVVFIVWLGIAGVHIGYAVPATGHVVKYLGEPVTWGLALLFMLQLVRAIELAFREWGVSFR